MKEIIKTSIFLSSLQKMQIWQRFIISRLYKIYPDSRIYRLIIEFLDGTKINFRYSFLGRIAKITEIQKGYNLVILNNSRCIRYLLGVYKIWKDKIADYLIGSEVINFFVVFEKKFYSLPVKTGSIIIITTILTNILFSLFSNKEIGLFSWGIQLLLLFIGLEGLHCNVTWQDLKKRSILINYINNYCKI